VGDNRKEGLQRQFPLLSPYRERAFDGAGLSVRSPSDLSDTSSGQATALPKRSCLIKFDSGFGKELSSYPVFSRSRGKEWHRVTERNNLN
jgi:hypothetical protein